MSCSRTETAPTGTLDLSFEMRNGMTQLVSQRFSGLLRASRPIYRQNRSSPEVQLIHLGPGNMNGDQYRQCIRLGPDAFANVGYQSFSKVLPGMQGTSQTMTVILEPGSMLQMGSNVVLPFSKSRYIASTDIYLTERATAFVPEIVLVQPHLEFEIFDLIRFQSTLRVHRCGRVVLRDCLDVGHESLTRARTWTRRYPVVGNVYILGVSGDYEPTFQTICKEASLFSAFSGVSVMEGAGLVMRILGSRVQDVQNVVTMAAEAYEKIRRDLFTPM